MNREYLHVNSSRWKTQVALLWGRGSSPPPPSSQPHPLTVQSSSPWQGTGWTKLPGVIFFKCQRSRMILTPHPFLLLHSCVCKIAASDRSVVKLPPPQTKDIKQTTNTRSETDREIHELSPRPPPSLGTRPRQRPVQTSCPPGSVTLLLL